MFKWQGQRKYLLITLALIIILGTIAPAAVAAEPAKPTVTIDQAISNALSNSEAVKKATNTVNLKEESRNYSYQQNGYAPTAAAYNFTAMVEVPYFNLLSSDLDWQMSKKTLTSQQDGIAMDACNKYWSVQKYQEKLKIAELGLKNALRQLQNAQAGNRVGTIADSGLLGTKTQYQLAQSALDSAKNDLDKAFIAFNQVVGLRPEDRPILTDTVEYKPINIESLDYEVARVLGNSPTVWLAEQNVKMQKYTEEKGIYSGVYRNAETRKLEMDQVLVNAASTKEAAEQSTRSSYYAIKSVEDNYPAALDRVKVAEDNLRITKIKFDIGMSTATDVATDEKALADAKYSIFETNLNHEYMKLAFRKPWAASAQ